MPAVGDTAIFNSDSTKNLWVYGFVPGTPGIGLWLQSSLTNDITLQLGGSAYLSGAVNVGGNTGYALKVDSRNLTFHCITLYVWLGNSQTWYANAGSTVTLNGNADKGLVLQGYTLTLAGAGNFAINASFGGNANGNGNITMNGTGNLTLGDNRYYNSIGGVTTLNSGTAILNAAEVSGTSGPFGRRTTVGAIVLGGGYMKYTSQNGYDYSSRFSTALNQKYNVDTGGTNVTWATALTSTNGTLTKIGNGTLTLSGQNTYTGLTTVANGTLRLSNVSCLSTNTEVSIASGATLDLNYSGTLTVHSLTVNGKQEYADVYDASNLSGYLSGRGSLKVLYPKKKGTRIIFY